MKQKASVDQVEKVMANVERRAPMSQLDHLKEVLEEKASVVQLRRLEDAVNSREPVRLANRQVRDGEGLNIDAEIMEVKEEVKRLATQEQIDEVRTDAEHKVSLVAMAVAAQLDDVRVQVEQKASVHQLNMLEATAQAARRQLDVEIEELRAALHLAPRVESA